MGKINSKIKNLTYRQSFYNGCFFIAKNEYKKQK